MRVLRKVGDHLLENGRVTPIELDNGEDLGGLVLLMVVAGGPARLRLVDNASLHGALASAASWRRPPTPIRGLGHRPDPMVGRRVTGLDAALRRLVRDGLLIPADGLTWQPSPTAERESRAALAALPSSARASIRRLARFWQDVSEREAARRTCFATG